MKNGTVIVIGVAAVAALIGGAMLMGSSGSSTPSPKGSNPNRPGQVGGLKGPSGNAGTGVSVDKKTCAFRVYDLGAAQTNAYNLGRTHSLEQAKALLFQTSNCSGERALVPSTDQLRNYYLVMYQLLRGSVDGGQTPRSFAEIKLMDVYFQLVVAKANVEGLPRNFP